MSDPTRVPSGETLAVDTTETRATPGQYATADRLKDRIALHQRFGDESEDFHSWLFRQVQAPTHARVLEVGCGTGTLWLVNRGKVPRGWQLTLSDLSEGMLREAEFNLRHEGLDVVFNRHGAQRLPYPDDAFDVVFANHMLYHVSDVPQALAEIRRVLKTGGRLYAATNGEQHMGEVQELHRLLVAMVPQAGSEPIDIGSFSMESGAALLEEHFDEVRLFERRDQLIVTEVEPLVRYVLSLTAPLPELEAGGPSTPAPSQALAGRRTDTAAAVARWRQAVADRFQSGVFPVRRVTGFFEAL